MEPNIIITADKDVFLDVPVSDLYLEETQYAYGIMTKEEKMEEYKFYHETVYVWDPCGCHEYTPDNYLTGTANYAEEWYTTKECGFLTSSFVVRNILLAVRLRAHIPEATYAILTRTLDTFRTTNKKVNPH